MISAIEKIFRDYLSSPSLLGLCGLALIVLIVVLYRYTHPRAVAGLPVATKSKAYLFTLRATVSIIALVLLLCLIGFFFFSRPDSPDKIYKQVIVLVDSIEMPGVRVQVKALNKEGVTNANGNCDIILDAKDTTGPLRFSFSGTMIGDTVITMYALSADRLSFNLSGKAKQAPLPTVAKNDPVKPAPVNPPPPAEDKPQKTEPKPTPRQEPEPERRIKPAPPVSAELERTIDASDLELNDIVKVMIATGGKQRYDSPRQSVTVKAAPGTVITFFSSDDTKRVVRF